LVWRSAESTRKRLFCTTSGSRRVRVRGSQPSHASRAVSLRAARVHTTTASTWSSRTASCTKSQLHGGGAPRECSRCNAAHAAVRSDGCASRSVTSRKAQAGSISVIRSKFIRFSHDEPHGI